MSLTKLDLQNIKQIIDISLEEKLEKKLEEKLDQKLEEKLTPIKRELKKIARIVEYNRDLLNDTISFFSKRYDNHEQRIVMLENQAS